jgi:glycosyltransferase involved in cell wall biosynthesis
MTPAIPSVLHVIPTRIARGAQREARALADVLHLPGVRTHSVLSLFDGPPQVDAELAIDYPGGEHPGAGFDPRLVLVLRRALDRLDPTVIVAHGSEPMKYLVPAAIGRRRPLVYYAIGTYSGSGQRAQLLAWRLLVRRAAVVASVGDEVRSECIELLGMPADRVLATVNGRDPGVFHPPVRRTWPSTPLLLFVGALTRGKRPDRFIELVAELRALGIPLRAEMVGDGPLAGELADAADAAGVERLGSRSDVAYHLRRADLLVFPSRPEGEGMPGVLVEAGLSGVPVVATDVPGVRQIVCDGRTGSIVPVDDLPALVTATTDLLADRDRRSAMGRAARLHCTSKFSVDAAGARLLTIVTPLLEHRRSAAQR